MGEPTITHLQQAAYDAQASAALPTSELAEALFGGSSGTVPVRQAAAYLRAVQATPWFHAAFAGHTGPLEVVGGRGPSRTDTVTRQVKIGTEDRRDPGRCEHACLHELAHIVTNDLGADRELREPVDGPDSSRGHHHAWRVNFVLIVRMALGRQASSRLRREFNEWGLPTFVGEPRRCVSPLTGS